MFNKVNNLYRQENANVTKERKANSPTEIRTYLFKYTSSIHKKGKDDGRDVK
jgi:hypothetical protein